MKARCFRCGDKPAKIPEYHSQPVFCTKRCAADYGVEQVVMDHQWCGRHNEWYDMNDGCLDCMEEKGSEY